MQEERFVTIKIIYQRFKIIYFFTSPWDPQAMIFTGPAALGMGPIILFFGNFKMRPQFVHHLQGSWSKRPHSKMATPKMATKLFATKTATTKMATLHLVKTATEEGSLPKRPHCIWSKRPQREDHYQNGHTIAKWPQRQLTWSRKEGGPLPKRPLYCLFYSLNTSHYQKQPHYLPLASQQSLTCGS